MRLMSVSYIYIYIHVYHRMKFYTGMVTYRNNGRKRCKQHDFNEIVLILRTSARNLSFDSSTVSECPDLLFIHIYFVNLSLQFS